MIEHSHDTAPCPACKPPHHFDLGILYGPTFTETLLVEGERFEIVFEVEG